MKGMGRSEVMMSNGIKIIKNGPKIADLGSQIGGEVARPLTMKQSLPTDVIVAKNITNGIICSKQPNQRPDFVQSMLANTEVMDCIRRVWAMAYPGEKLVLRETDV
jgi:hypothetical protein